VLEPVGSVREGALWVSWAASRCRALVRSVEIVPRTDIWDGDMVVMTTLDVTLSVSSIATPHV
jgi:hypothetical protein